MKPRSRIRGPILFVTVGSTRFDKLIEKLLSDESLNQIINLGFARLIMQVGQSDYDPKKFAQLKSSLSLQIELELYEYKSSIAEDIERADLVVGHAGAGTCLEVLRANKRLLLVVNDSLMDNHQNELADQLARDNYVVKTTLERLNQDLAHLYDGETKLDQFPQKDSAKFEEIFNETLKRVASRL